VEHADLPPPHQQIEEGFGFWFGAVQWTRERGPEERKDKRKEGEEGEEVG
jgi:hypothetical protein